MNVTTVARSVFAVLLVSTGLSAQEPSNSPSRVSTHVFVGTGTFATPVDVTDGSTSIRVPLVGAALDVAVGTRWRIGMSLGGGALPGATTGGSTAQGLFGDATALWLVAQTRRWGLLLGPAATVTRFDVARTGVGGVISAGVLRGRGPRLTLRTYAMSGDELGVASRFEVGWVLTR